MAGPMVVRTEDAELERKVAEVERAYLATLSDSPIFAGMSICAGDGHLQGPLDVVLALDLPKIRAKRRRLDETAAARKPCLTG